MNKITNHFKQYAAIYLILVLIAAVCLIIFLQPNKEGNEKGFDTSFFNVVDTKGAVALFKGNKDQVLFIGRPGCSACQQFGPYLQVAMAQYHFSVSYLNLDEVDRNSEEYQQLLEKLDYEYTLNGKKGKFSDFIGATPMFIIIKNNRMVFGYIGLMSNQTIGTFVTQYGITEEM